MPKGFLVILENGLLMGADNLGFGAKFGDGAAFISADGAEGESGVWPQPADKSAKITIEK